MKEIKKQIDNQTRSKVGSVKVESQSSLFSEETGTNWNIGRTGEPPLVIWNKTSYSMDRGTIFNLTPEAFNAPASQISNQMVPTITGNFRETNTIPLYNCRYSGWAGVTGGGTVSLSVRTGNSNVSIWVDGIMVAEVYSETFNPVNVELSISDLSLIQIFWYSYVANNSISIVGDLSHQLSVWNTSDSTPFFRTVEWYTEDPITSDAAWNFALDNYIRVKWWFNIVEDVEETEGPDISAYEYTDVADLGGFGIWGIDFQEAGAVDIIDGDTIAISGYFPSISYLRIPSIVGGIYDAEGRILEVEYIDSYNAESNISYLIVTAHGLNDTDDGRIIEVGILRNVAEIAFSTLNSAVTDVFETVERGLIRGQRYYYLIDTYDSSPSKNRGGMTETYQTIIAGDYSAPGPVAGLTGTRIDGDSVEITWNGENPFDIASWNVYTDANSLDYQALLIEADFFALTDYTALEEAWLASDGQVLISVEITGGGKYIRRIADAPGGGLFNFQTSIPEAGAGSGIIRFVEIVSTINQIIPTVPETVPQPRDYETI